MYSVSDAFLEAIKKPAVDYILAGTIGNVSFDEGNIVDGSFHISNQSTDTSDIVLGSVFLGQLQCKFTGIAIEYTSWIGKDISPSVSVKINETTWETLPLGVFRVMEAKHTAEGVAVTAYDNMRKFDRRIKKAHFRNVEANLHTFVGIMCTDCHVTFGMTLEEFSELPNATETTTIFGYTRATKKYSNDIETYRDLLFYMAQAMGCFATMNRSGQLVFVKYKGDVVETISDSQRLEGAQFADYITNYTGIYVTNMKDETDSYYGYDYELINTEINLCNEELEQIESDLVELQRQYDEHEITEEEYLAQKKVLERDRKQVNKRLNWLYKARDKAQAGDEGTFMDLGGNPFLQDSNLTVQERMRRKVLKALDPISYTPFDCDSIFGIHYDLGDVIYFTGGHAGTDGVFCSVMSFDWTLNQEYKMQGYGVDPSILNIKDRNTKKTKEANTNALNAKEMSSGFDAPSNADGKEDDIYIKYATKTTYSPLYPIKYEGQSTCAYNPPSQPYHFTKPSDIVKVTTDKIDWDVNRGVYDFNVQGYVYSNIWSTEQPAAGANGATFMPYFKIIIPEERGRYKITFDASWDCPDGGYAVSIGFTDWTSSTDTAVSVPSVAVRMSGGSTMTHYEYVRDYLPGHDEYYVWIQMWFPLMPSSGPGKAYMDMKIRNLRVERVIDPGSGTTDGGVTTETEKYIDGVFVKEADETTGVESWKEIEYVAGIDESSHSGLELDYKRYLHLTPEVMRAWLKADPPQAAQTSNRFCVRYTGKPDTALNIAFWGNSGWLNKSIKRDSEGAYTLKSGGTVSSGVVEYCGYTITGLVAGERYYFNFKANFKDGTQFGDDYDKGLGIVLTTAGIISTDDFSGDPHTFDPDTGYCSFYRSTAARFYDFSFVAPASSIHMFVTVGDIVDGQTSSLTLSRFVISRNEKDYIRQFYIYDTESNDWLQYKPWGSDEEGESTSLSDLDDVNIGTVTNGQVLKYDSSIGAWVNADEGTGTEVEANPAGTATGELKKIAIDDDIYKIVDDDAVHTDDVGTAAAKDFTTSISSQNTNLPTSGAVKDAIDAAISSAYKPSGSKTVAELVSSLLVAANMGNVYNMSDSGETTSDFVEGAGKTINTGDNVGIVNIGTDANPVYKFDLLSGFIDMSDYYDKDEVDDLLDAKANNTPTFTEASERTNLAGSGETMTTILGKIKKFFSDLKTVAFSGSYNDLSNKPTIPTVNNGTLTIQKNGTAVETFTANSSTNKTANITVPTKTSDLNNDSGFVTTDEKVTGQVQNPTSGAWYNVPFIGTSNQKPYYNEGFRNYTQDGTANAAGRSILSLGNNIAYGTAGNKRGELWLYANSNKYVNLKANPNITGDREIFFPDAGGTIMLSTTYEYNKEIAVAGSSRYILIGKFPCYDSNVTIRITNTTSTTSCATVVLGTQNINDSHGGVYTFSCYGDENYSIASRMHLLYPSNSRIMEIYFDAGGYSKNCIHIQAVSLNAAPTNIVETVSSIPSGTITATNIIDYFYVRKSGGTVDKAKELIQLYTVNSRPTDADLASNNNGGIRKFLATSEMTSHKPMSDGHIIQLDWDNSNFYASQIFVPNSMGSTPHMQFRAQGGSNTWSSWVTLIDSNSIGSQAVDKATKDGDGNTISSTYMKLNNLYGTGYLNSGTATAATTGYRDIASITITQSGIYLVSAWAQIKGGTGNKAVLICRGSDNAAWAQSWEDSTINTSYPKTFSCYYVLEAIGTLPTVKARVYTTNNNSSEIKGGICAIRVL